MTSPNQPEIVEHWATSDNKHQLYLLTPSTAAAVRYLAQQDDGSWQEIGGDKHPDAFKYWKHAYHGRRVA